MSTLAQVRAAAASALSGVSGWTVTAQPANGAVPKAGDGWITVVQLRPADFSVSMATMRAVLILGEDAELADTTFDSDATSLINAITSAMNVADVVAEPALMGQAPGETYGILITFSAEVD